MPTHRRKQTTIEAAQWDGTLASYKRTFEPIACTLSGFDDDYMLLVPTETGMQRAFPGDYVITERSDTYPTYTWRYVCPRITFEALYESYDVQRWQIPAHDTGHYAPLQFPDAEEWDDRYDRYDTYPGDE